MSDTQGSFKSFKLGDKVEKIRGSQWKGTVVGTYSTELTPEGYAVESNTEKGSVQIYPAAALKLTIEPEINDCKTCSYYEYEMNGPRCHCYMFREEPKFKCMKYGSNE